MECGLRKSSAYSGRILKMFVNDHLHLMLIHLEHILKQDSSVVNCVGQAFKMLVSRNG